ASGADAPGRGRRPNRRAARPDELPVRVRPVPRRGPGRAAGAARGVRAGAEGVLGGRHPRAAALDGAAGGARGGPLAPRRGRLPGATEDAPERPATAAAASRRTPRRGARRRRNRRRPPPPDPRRRRVDRAPRGARVTERLAPVLRLAPAK